MPDAQGRLFVSDIAKLIGIAKSDWRARVSRGHAPASVGYVEVHGVSRAVWDPEVIAAYAEARDKRLAARDEGRADAL
jgi:hypothetical protein